MQMSSETHYEIIRIAVGYSLLGVFVVTAILCVLSLVHTKSSPESVPRALVIIDPPWVRKSLYSSIFIQVVAAAVLFWKSMLAIDTSKVSQDVQEKIEKQGVVTAEEDIKKIGILRYWSRSNEFLPYIHEAMENAKAEIWVSGASFYLSVTDNEDVIVARAKQGIKIKYLFLDPYGSNLEAVAATFSQAPEELRQECLTTIHALTRIRNKLPDIYRENLEVRLFNESPRARFYIFDPDDENANTFFVPHVNSVNSPNIPGFLLSNKPYGLAQIYIASVKDFWNSAKPLNDWWALYPIKK